MSTRFSYMKRALLIAVSFGIVSASFAKMERWTDTQGNAFKAEPAEVVGPFALFRLPSRAGKLLPLNMLSEQDCVRFANAVRSVPAPAADWAQTKTAFGGELLGSVQRVRDGKLVEVDLKGTPEPRFYVLYFASNGEGKSWGMLGQSAWRLPQLQQKFPGMLEGVMFGLKHSESDQSKMAVQMNVPYLVADLADTKQMERIGRLVPGFGFGVVVSNAAGVPLFGPVRGDTDEEAKKILADLEGILELLKPDNPRALAPRYHYWKAVQPVLHATGECGPLLLGEPLNVQALAELGVKPFEATLFISAEGTVTAVKIAAGAGIPDELLQPITEALQKAVFVAAVDNGKFVAGKSVYRFGAN